MRPPPCLTLPYPRPGTAPTPPARSTRSPKPARAAFAALARWPGATCRVGFLEAIDPRLGQAIAKVMRQWEAVCGFRFQFVGWPVAQVRITLAGSDWWSCVGTEALGVAAPAPTMALGGCTLAALNPGGILHETGHVLGMEHEHQRPDVVARIDPAAAYKVFWDWYGWSKADVDAYVLTPLDPQTHWFSKGPADSDSIMAYELPASVMRDHKAFGGTATGISPIDARLVAAAYPQRKR